MNAQIALMCSSDARATGLLAAAASLAGVAVATGFAIKDDSAFTMLLFVCWGAGVLATGASAAALWAIWPLEINLPGWKPMSFESDWDKTEVEVIQEMLPLNHDKIEENDQIIVKLHRRSLLAMSLLAVTPIGGLAAGFLVLNPFCKAFGLLMWGGVVWMLFLFFVPKHLRTPT
jgi:hypothetical protein